MLSTVINGRCSPLIYISLVANCNKYALAGLPPGPIVMPDLSSIKAVLDPEQHEYIYFCANPEQPGYHAFAKNPQEHSQNRAKYIAWLEKNNIE